MTLKKYNQMRVIVALFVSSLVSIGVTLQLPILSGAAVLTGIVFLTAVRRQTKIIVDEREVSIRQKAAQLTYAIFTPTIGIGSYFLLLFGQQKTPYIFALGQVMAYLTLFIITIYAVSVFFLNKRYSGDNHEE